nr:MAG TPA: hypothetical protein [Caudoviricetes sp.]
MKKPLGLAQGLAFLLSVRYTEPVSLKREWIETFLRSLLY